MSEPMSMQALLVSTMAGALIVLSGAFYAMFFALGRLKSSRLFAGLGLAAYVLLVACVAALADALALDGFWTLVTATMLCGYFLLPRAIWHLCQGTHRTEEHELEFRARTDNDEVIR